MEHMYMKSSVAYILVEKELKLERTGFIYLNLNEIFMSCFVIYSFKYNINIIKTLLKIIHSVYKTV